LYDHFSDVPLTHCVCERVSVLEVAAK